MRQIDRMLKIILDNPTKKIWSAKDFQYGKYFIGYEASARMSDIIRMYPEIFIVGKDGRFRTIEVNWKKKRLIKKIKKMVDEKETICK